MSMAEMNEQTLGTAVTKPKGIPVNLPNELLQSLCFNCDNRGNCSFVDKRKTYCELFE